MAEPLIPDTMTALPRDESGQTFAEPWQAQVFALTVRLSQAGYFTWTEWVDYFSAVVAADKDRAQADHGAAYFLQWLAALERIVDAKGLASTQELLERKAAWKDAAHNTPFGEPIELRRVSAQG